VRNIHAVHGCANYLPFLQILKRLFYFDHMTDCSQQNRPKQPQILQNEGTAFAYTWVPS
jgi:hypothetical protein